ncbi:MAG: hypothetical protein ACI3V2_02945 [Faecousia sp.]
MNLFSKLSLRRAVFSALLGLLLSAAVAVSSIGVAAWWGANVQREQVNAQYTTIAVPRGDVFWTGLLYENNTPTPFSCQTERDYPGLMADDCRGFLAAHVEGCETLSAYELDNFGSPDFDAYGNSLAVVAVRCTSVAEYNDPIQQAVYDENDELIGTEELIQRSYEATFSIEDIICRFSAYDTVLPEANEISFGSSVFSAEGEVPFEEGKTYLLFGNYEGPSVFYDDFAEEGVSPWEFRAPEIHRMTVSRIDSMTSSGFDTGNLLFSWEKIEDGKKIAYRLTEDSLPFYAEYSGSWQDFLQRDVGQVWRERILPMCQINYESAGVVLTDQMNSLLLFNTGEAAVLEGRSFDAGEYAEGTAVCLVSVAYAQKNALSVGDTIHLDFYQTELGYRENGNYRNNGSAEPILVHGPCRAENRIGVQKDYTVVGIYTAPEFSYGLHRFQADTIFVPKASVPNASAYENILHPLLYSVILKNGTEADFEAYMESLGYGGVFSYFDQDYNALAETLTVISANALRLLVIGSSIFLLAAALFLFLNFRRAKPIAYGLRLLGILRRKVQRELFAATAILTLIAVAVGAALGAALYRVVTARVLSELIALRPGALLLCAALQLLVLLFLAAVCACRISGGKLMQGRRKKSE